jgi:hypothetical protein
MASTRVSELVTRNANTIPMTCNLDSQGRAIDENQTAGLSMVLYQARCGHVCLPQR